MVLCRGEEGREGSGIPLRSLISGGDGVGGVVLVVVVVMATVLF